MDTPKAKMFRRTGYAILGAITLFLTVPMIAGAVNGIRNQQIWDPYTDKPLAESNATEAHCRTRAEELIRDSANMVRKEPGWEEQVRVWTAKCRSDHPEAYQMLMLARRRIGKTTAPRPESAP